MRSTALLVEDIVHVVCNRKNTLSEAANCDLMKMLKFLWVLVISHNEVHVIGHP